MLVEIRALSLTLGYQSILHDVSLTLGAGEIYGLIGPNGAGKSTTIAAALGLRKRDGGSIRIFDKDPNVDAAAIHARCGVLPEQNGFYDWMTAGNYLAFFARLYGQDRRRGDILDLLAQVGLELRVNQAIGTFSRGMRQRLGLARALVGNPELLILDEPTNGLDPHGRREIHDLLISLARRGMGILLCTHLIDDVDRLCNRIGIISQGCTIVEGNLKDLLESRNRGTQFRLRLTGPLPQGQRTLSHVAIVSRQDEWVEVNLAPGTAAADAWRELLITGWPIAEVHAAATGLEGLYFDLIEEKAP